VTETVIVIEKAVVEAEIKTGAPHAEVVPEVGIGIVSADETKIVAEVTDMEGHGDEVVTAGIVTGIAGGGVLPESGVADHRTVWIGKSLIEDRLHQDSAWALDAPVHPSHSALVVTHRSVQRNETPELFSACNSVRESEQGILRTSFPPLGKFGTFE